MPRSCPVPCAPTATASVISAPSIPPSSSCGMVAHRRGPHRRTHRPHQPYAPAAVAVLSRLPRPRRRSRRLLDARALAGRADPRQGQALPAVLDRRHSQAQPHPALRRRAGSRHPAQAAAHRRRRNHRGRARPHPHAGRPHRHDQPQIAHAHHQLDALTARTGTSGEAEPGQPTQRDAEILASLPGIGRIVLATLLAEATDALQRRDYPALRCLAGVAPVTKKSGRSHIVLPATPATTASQTPYTIGQDRRNTTKSAAQIRRPSPARSHSRSRPAIRRRPPPQRRLFHAQSRNYLQPGLLCPK